MVKVGIVGCGTITMVRHAPEYYNNPDAEIAGFYDIVPERAAELAGKFGGKVYETCDELLADTTIDAVSICTANDTHAEYTVKALAAGKNVLCEKPMATSGTPISADDNAYCILKTSTGIIGTIKSSWTNYGLESNQTIIYCTDGVVIIGGESTNRIELQKRDGTQVKYTFPDASTNQKQVPSGVIDSFVSSIKNNRTVEVSSFEGYSTIATVLACYESSNCSRGIPISQYDNR